MTVVLTDTAINKAAKLTVTTGRIELSDASWLGLRLRISSKQSQTWVLACRDVKGRMRRFTLGSYPDMGIAAARAAARALHVQVKVHGADPIADKRSVRAQAAAPMATLNNLLDIYGEKVGIRKKSWPEARKRIESVFPPLTRRALSELSRNEIQIMADGYPAVMSASAAIRYLRPVLKWGAQRGYVEEGIALLHPPAPIKRRKRYLSDAELAKVLSVMRTSTRSAWRIMYFIFLTLSRREEASRARWCHIDWGLGTWTIPNTKNDEPHIVPLSKQAIAFLENIRPTDKKSDGFIFATSAGTSQGNWDRETKALHASTGTSGWHRHDLRRTSATILGNLGELPDFIEASLNHVSIHSSLAATYNLSRYRPEVQLALQRLADYLDAIEENAK